MYSMIHSWLIQVYGNQSPDEDVQDINAEIDCISNINRKRPKHPLNDSFCEVVIEYCSRILNQVERQTSGDHSNKIMKIGFDTQHFTTESDWSSEAVESISVEAVKILDTLCTLNPKHVSRTFETVKKTLIRTATSQSGLVFTVILQFLLNHSSHVIFDIEPPLHKYFGEYLCTRIRNKSSQLLAISAISLLCNNYISLIENTSVFIRYIPCIFQIIAFHPRSTYNEFIKIIPSLVGIYTYIDMFHGLLDLPLTCAVIELAEYQDHVTIDRKTPIYRRVESYILRSESVSENIWDDEICVLYILNLWKHFPLSPRISYVCKLIPNFLNIYINIILNYSNIEYIKNLIIIILNRFNILYPIDFYQNEVRSVLINTLLKIFQTRPKILRILSKTIVQSVKQQLTKDCIELVITLTWVIGELLTPPDEEDEHNMQDMCLENEELFESLEFLANRAISHEKESIDSNDAIITETFTPLGVSIVTAVLPPSIDTNNEDILDLSPRLLSVVIGGITKMCIRFPGYGPRGVKCLFDLNNNLPNLTKNAVKGRILESLNLLNNAGIYI
eukprot:GHVL01012742.1.p1 GENE.GHVL01012742.1~~GHVL01012742.1.p1  ORF type:complete len:560 (-),score=135.12 GHVL01012742.1:416-2095(-)